MRIAQIAPLVERVPPHLYGGTERIVSLLTEELVAQGHEVTLFASGDSETTANLIPCCDQALRLSPLSPDPLPYHVMMLEALRRRVDEFDVVHAHIDFLLFPLLTTLSVPCLTTLHGRLDLPGLSAFYDTFPDFPLVSISDSQRTPLPRANYVATIHHGIRGDLIPFSPEGRGGYLAFLGRISPEKRPDRAIRIARAVGLPLKIAAKVDKQDRDYWVDVIRPLIAGDPLIEFVGEISEREKPKFLGDALGLLFPIDWPEPFGLVMIEAMACGTPVLAFRCGSVPEIVDHGISGLIVETMDQAIVAIEDLLRLDRRAVRVRFEERFHIERMARQYVEIYEQLTFPTETEIDSVLALQYDQTAASI